ncbi:MAG: hypothetical protein HOV81_21800 [Kofleriaceae bacterium]|nr:hypothetical protein [Kofleriaceae bacterium]
MHGVLILFFLSAATTAALIAQSKRHSWPLWFVLGGLFPLFAILVILVVPSRKEVTRS